MKCALVWRNGYAELRVMQCNADEHEYLKKQIGKSVEVEIRPTPLAPDLGWVCGKCKTHNADNVSLCGFCDTPRLSG